MKGTSAKLSAYLRFRQPFGPWPTPFGFQVVCGECPGRGGQTGLISPDGCGEDVRILGLGRLRDRVDGILLVGPTFANPIRAELTANRDPDTPQWIPARASQPSVRFARTPADLEGLRESGDPPRVVYLQHPSDPTTWWNLELAFRKPAWAGGPAAPDRSPAFRWIPIVTFWQTGIDLANSLGVPAGHGHYFGTDVVDGWVAVSPPDRWRPDDTERLRDLLGDDAS